MFVFKIIILNNEDVRESEGIAPLIPNVDNGCS